MGSDLEDLVSGRCDICGAGSADELTAAERQAWPSIAKWIRHACPVCRDMFRRSAEKPKAAA